MLLTVSEVVRIIQELPCEGLLMVERALDEFKNTLFQLGQMRFAVADGDVAGMHWAGWRRKSGEYCWRRRRLLVNPALLSHLSLRCSPVQYQSD